MKKWMKWMSVLCIGFMSLFVFAACNLFPVGGDKNSSEDNYCTVSFELCTDLRTNNIMAQEVEVGGTVSKPIVAVIGENPNNMEVDSWYIDAKYTTQWNFLTDTVSADLTLYAKWIGKFNVNYYLGDNTETPMYTQEVKEGDILVALSELSDGYKSNGFFTSPDYTEEFEFGKPVTKDENIYIHRSKEIYFSGDMIARRFVPQAASSGAGSVAGTIKVEGEGDDNYAVANFGYSTAADPFMLLKNVTVDISHSQKIRITFKNMGNASSLKFYFVAWYDDETKEYVDQAFFSEAASYLYKYTDVQKNMTADDDWLVLEFDIANATMKNGISLWGNAKTLIQLRMQSGYISENEEDFSNVLWIKSIEGISDPSYVYDGDSEEVTALLADDAAEKVEAVANAQEDVVGWVFPKDNALVSGEAKFYQKENGLLMYSVFRKQNTTLILKVADGETIDLDELTTLMLRIQNFGYANSFEITYRNKKGRSATQEVIINSRSSSVEEYKLNMFGATNWSGSLDTLMITYNSVGCDNALLFESIVFSDFEVVKIPGFNFNDKYTFGCTSNDAMEISYASADAGSLINVIDPATAVIEKTYDVAYTTYGYQYLTLNYKAYDSEDEEGITKVIVGLTIGDVETLYNYDITLENTSISLPFETTGNVQKVRITFEGTGEIVIKNIKFELDSSSSMDFSTSGTCEFINAKKWTEALSFDSATSATIYAQAGSHTEAKYYFNHAKISADRGEGNIDLAGKSKIIVAYQNTGVALNFQLALGFVNKTDDDSWKTAHIEPYSASSDVGAGGGAQFTMLRGNMSETEWDYIEIDLLQYKNISAETIDNLALSVILMEFKDATVSTSIRIRAISII